MSLSSNVVLRLSAALLLFVAVGATHANEFVNALPDGVAMDGFDVVAYHTLGEPTKGDAAHAVEYKGKTWLFSSADNASAFAALPAQYEPEHNGWCSYAVSEGYGAEVDFVNGWAVLDGKLYLNWNAEVRNDFVAQRSKRIPEAEKLWKSVHAGLQDGSVKLYTHADESVDIAHPQQVE